MNKFYIPFFLLLPTNFIYFKCFFITIIIKSLSLSLSLLLILMIMRDLFSFLLKLNSHHPYTFTSRLKQTLKQNHQSLQNCNSFKNMLKLLAFSWLLKELLLETERSEVIWIWWFVSIKFINFLKKISFLMSLFKLFSL